MFLPFVFLAFVCWLVLTFGHGRFWQLLVDSPPSAPTPAQWPRVDIIVPARNEARALPKTLPTLLAQNYAGAWRVIVVDDNSEDGTHDVAVKTATEKGKKQHLHVIKAPPRPKGWSGKVAAMQAGVTESDADYILFTDADIAHEPDSLSRLVHTAVQNRLDLTSRMVLLNCQSPAEKLLIPAFVFFFALLYPFRLSNRSGHPTAAAAGGTMLVRRTALDTIGGLAAIKSALIDDCSLAKAIKERGGDKGTEGRIQLGLTRSIRSLRRYPRVRDVWRMIARTAFTQLRHSVLLLAGSVLGLTLLFASPIIMLLTHDFLTALIAFATWGIMTIIYSPMVRFYGLPLFWSLTLPLAALIYIAATIDSARLYWQGRGGQWKGRSQA